MMLSLLFCLFGLFFLLTSNGKHNTLRVTLLQTVFDCFFFFIFVSSSFDFVGFGFSLTTLRLTVMIYSSKGRLPNGTRDIFLFFSKLKLITSERRRVITSDIFRVRKLDMGSILSRSQTSIVSWLHSC